MSNFMKFLLVLLLSLFCIISLQAKELVHFSSLDGLTVSAALYSVEDPKAPLIILFHQASWSRGEYIEIAPKLNKLGYSCLAVDLRSGGKVNGILNETKVNALKKGYETNYSDSYMDMEAALSYAQKKLKPAKLIIWGSSYSASLVFRLGADFPNLVDAIIAFSPGEYFRNHSVKNDALLIQQPVFITSAAREKNMWFEIFEAIPHSAKQYFMPKSPGNHGSRALWKKFDDSQMYWKAVEMFLAKNG